MLERVYEMHVTSNVGIQAKWIFEQGGCFNNPDTAGVYNKQGGCVFSCKHQAKWIFQ